MMITVCNHQETRVIESRIRKDGRLYRRRECVLCGYRFSTVEIAQCEYEKLQSGYNKLQEILSAYKVIQ